MKRRTKTRVAGNTFQPGNQLSVGNKGGGRKPDWFKNRCDEIFRDEELLEFVAAVAKGNTFAQLHPAGVIDAPPTIKNRLEAVQMLKEWAYGKDDTPANINAIIETVELKTVATEKLLEVIVPSESTEIENTQVA